MYWRSIKDPDIRAKYLSMGRKTLLQQLRSDCESRPVFVLGKQRSGTSMLMFCFHRHPEVLVFDEHRNNPAFQDFRLRDSVAVRQLIQRSRLPFVCFKPICDSHRIHQLLDDFPDARCVWIYRDFRDVANSSLRKFDAPTRAIRLVCTNQEGGGWFQEGVSPAVAAVLRQVYTPDLSAFDLSCLVWWARNQIVLEQGVLDDDRVTLLQSETLVTAPETTLRWLFGRLGVPYVTRVATNIQASSVARHHAEPMNPRVQMLCEETLTALDGRFRASLEPEGSVRADAPASGVGVPRGVLP